MLVIREAAIVVVGYLCRQRQAVKAQSWHFLDVLNEPSLPWIANRRRQDALSQCRSRSVKAM